jgi:hypothetical protein
MDGERDDGGEGRPAIAADTFSLLANKHRTAIMRALAAPGEDGHDPAGLTDHQVYAADAVGPPTKSYSELKAATGIRDNGQFNYHLNELLGTFVRKVDDRYRLTWLGLLADHMAATKLETDDVGRSFDADADCLACGATLRAVYTDEQFFELSCPDCGVGYEQMHVAARGVEGHTDTGLLRAVASRAHHERGIFATGVCPRCSGPVERRVVLPPDADQAQTVPQPLVYCRCTACHAPDFPTVGGLLLAHPAVVGFYHDHGVDLRRTEPWTLPFAASRAAVTVESTDPIRLSVRARRDGETLVVAVDETGAVRGVERNHQ